MEPTTHTAASSVSSQLASSALPASPNELSDAELLTVTRRLVGRSNQLLASLLAHLGEVEARGIHRARACASLYAYCIYDLRFSEDEAFRRVSAARLTKKELARLVRSLDPLPAVPPRIEPLGPAALQLAPGTPSWSRWMSAMNPVRELESGARPRDWMDGVFSANDGSELLLDDNPESAEHAPARVNAVTTSAEHAQARVEPQRYMVQFEASEEYVELVERAKALLSHGTPRADLSELHLRAMRTLVAELQSQKYAVTARPRRRAEGSAQAESGHEHESEHESQAKLEHDSEVRHESEYDFQPAHEPQPERESESRPQHPRRRGRHVPAAIRRAVFERDEGALHVCERRGRALPGDGAARVTSRARVRARRRASPGQRDAPLSRSQHPRRRTGFRKGFRRARPRLDPARALEHSRSRTRRSGADTVQVVGAAPGSAPASVARRHQGDRFEAQAARAQSSRIIRRGH
jgi:hypothetical protein